MEPTIPRKPNAFEAFLIAIIGPRVFSAASHFTKLAIGLVVYPLVPVAFVVYYVYISLRWLHDYFYDLGSRAILAVQRFKNLK